MGKQVRCPKCSTTFTASPAAAPAEPATPRPPAASGPAKRKISCPGCQRQLAVGADAAGKVVQCPHCSKRLKIPGGAPAGSAPAPTQPPAAAADPFDFGNMGSGGGFPPAQAPVSTPGPAANPYAAPSGPASAQRASGSTSDRSGLYITNGVIHIIWGALLLLASVGRGIGIVLALTAGNVQVDAAELAGAIGGMCFSLVLSFAFIAGGLAMARRTGLSSAKTAAVLGAIPCFGCLIMPFSIWACVLLFDDRAKRDFSG